MPYHVGKKGSNGCSGFPVVTDKGHVMGCHPIKENADQQVAALYASGAAEKGMNLLTNFLSKPNSEIDKKYKVKEVCDCYSDCYCNK
jgi:hypothetical protein